MNVAIADEPQKAETTVMDTGSSHRSSRDIKVLPEVDGQSYEHEKFVVQDKSNNQAYVGTWKGEISMVDHRHPLTLSFKQEKDELDVSNDFWGMNFNEVEHISNPMIEVKNSIGGFELNLFDVGIKLNAKLTSADTVDATVFWMGHSQQVQFTKVVSRKKVDIDHVQHHNTRMNVAILLFDNVDVLDWAGPLEVFIHAHGFNTYTVASEMKNIKGGGYSVKPEYTFDTMPPADIVIVPGGNVGPLFMDSNTLDWIKQQGIDAEYLMSVCNAATLLASSDLLQGLKATTHQSWMPWLNVLSTHKNFSVVDGERFIDNGKIITTAGVSSGIDGALHIVAKLLGEERAHMTARMMEYDWSPTVDY